MRRWRATTIATTALAALLVLSGCGSLASGPGGGATDPDTAVSDGGSTSGMSADPGRHGKAELREPDPDVVNPRRVDWDKAKVKGRKITLFYYSGVKECYGLHHVEVKETDKRVTVTIYDGNDPDAEVCIELAQRVKTIVKLDRPLGSRTLVDGAE